MRIYFEDLKDETRECIFGELLKRIADEEPDYSERAQDIGMNPQEYLSEKADYLIDTRNFGVDMDF
jgi:hypothetical protein